VNGYTRSVIGPIRPSLASAVPIDFMLQDKLVGVTIATPWGPGAAE
jgi:hypothetical protein